MTLLKGLHLATSFLKIPFEDFTWGPQNKANPKQPLQQILSRTTKYRGLWDAEKRSLIMFVWTSFSPLFHCSSAVFYMFLSQAKLYTSFVTGSKPSCPSSLDGVSHTSQAWAEWGRAQSVVPKHEEADEEPLACFFSEELEPGQVTAWQHVHVSKTLLGCRFRQPHTGSS